MGDSEDEYDRKRRDKFRGERSDYRDNSARRAPPPDDMRPGRDDWRDNRSGDWGRRMPPRPIDYRLGGGHRMQHEFSPPNSKRPRGDWDRYSQDSGFSSYGSGYDQPPGSHFGGPPGAGGPRDSSDGQPQLLSFKSWLSTQDDTISDQEALSKYAEYKQEFKRQQLNEFFVAHREEEWFKNKYHPDECTKKKEEQYQNLKKRVDVFVDFLESKRFDEVSLDSPHAEKLIKLMDWYVIRLEGGTDEDAKKLLTDVPFKRSIPVTEEKEKPETGRNGEVETKQEEKREREEASGESDVSEPEMIDSEEGAASPSPGPKKPKKKNSTSVVADNHVADALENNNSMDGTEADKEQKADEEMENGSEPAKGQKRKLSTAESHSSAADVEGDGENKIKEEVDEDGKVIKKSVRQKILAPDAEEDLPQLHRTASIFLRNLAPSITKAEIEALCTKYPGYMRVAIADPQPDRRWSRRGWITFKRSVNIKEICWNFNNIRLRDTELGAIVNRDLTRRVRTVSGITPHKVIVRNDIKLAANVIQHLDSKWALWDEDKHSGAKESYGVYSTNPVLKNITDYLIEEASAEEEELLGMSGGGSDGELESGETQDKQSTVDRDEELIRVLDRMILYLRFVHSLDYYNHAEYPYEDDMPNRLGIIHGRGMPPAAKVNHMELQEYNRNFDSKIAVFSTPVVMLDDEEVKNLGRKEEETEVEKFITSNTQELGKDKWLCPLSGKKFKGPEFVRKHITNKHGEKLDEVRKEVIFFNNFLRDPRRPKNLDPNSRPAITTESGRPQPLLNRRDPMMPDAGGFHPPPNYPPYERPYLANPNYNTDNLYGMPYGGYGGYGGPRPPYQPYQPSYRGRAPYRGGYDGGRRPMISYRDLDAPNEPDDF